MVVNPISIFKKFNKENPIIGFDKENLVTDFDNKNR
jgi:hypothetical protein